MFNYLCAACVHVCKRGIERERKGRGKEEKEEKRGSKRGKEKGKKEREKEEGERNGGRRARSRVEKVGETNKGMETEWEKR